MGPGSAAAAHRRPLAHSPPSPRTAGRVSCPPTPRRPQNNRERGPRGLTPARAPSARAGGKLGGCCRPGGRPGCSPQQPRAALRPGTPLRAVAGGAHGAGAPHPHPPPRKQLAVQPTATGNGREQPGPRPRARLVARLPVLSPGGRPDLAPRQAPTGAKRMDLNVSPGHSPPGLPSLPGCPGPPGRGVPEGIQQAELASPQCPAGRAQLPCRPPGLTSRAVRLGLLWKGVDQVIAQRWPFTLKLAT